MKNFKALTVIAFLVVSANAFAAPKAKKVAAAPAPAKKIDFAKDVEGLGGNDDLMEMAAKLNPETKSRIVQERIVDRYNRLEVGVNYGGNMGGATYLQTQNLGGSIDFHFTPRFSVGARYYSFGNSLTPEGERAYQEWEKKDKNNEVAPFPEVDRPQNAAIGVVNWYPVYGKINFFDAAIAQFDIYVLAGGGQIALESGSTGLFTAGTGFGLWMTKHLTARAELRYQNYKDQISTGPRNINAMAATIGLGWIL